MGPFFVLEGKWYASGTIALGGVFLPVKCLPGMWRDRKRLKDTVLQAAELDTEEEERQVVCN